MNEQLPLVSVVITTKNEAKNIENCLKSILQQTYQSDRIEIIVVDNNSNDATKAIAEKYTDKVFNKGPERSAQRNFGARQAKGQYYLYLDADMTLSPGVIEEAVAILGEKNDLIALYVPEIIMGDGFWPKVRRFERGFYNATVIDCVRFVRLKDFLAVGGFDETMSGPEDWDFDKKLRNIGQTGLIKSPIYHNEASFNLKKYLKKKQYYTQSFDKYVKKWGKNDQDIKRQLGFFYRFFGVFWEKGKWRKLLKHPILTFAMYFLKFLVGFNYLINK